MSVLSTLKAWAPAAVGAMTPKVERSAMTLRILLMNASVAELSRSAFHGWEARKEHTPLFARLFQFDRPAVHLRDPTRDRKTQTGATFMTRWIEAYEPVKNALPLPGRYTCSSVSHSDD